MLEAIANVDIAKCSPTSHARLCLYRRTMTHWEFWETLSDSDTAITVSWADKQIGRQAMSDNGQGACL